MATLVSLSADPILRFVDDDNNPLVGGMLNTLVGGLPYPTYSDSAGNFPLPNPIILNSRGEVSTNGGISTPLYVNPNVAYTYVLTDANGAQIWTAPNIVTAATAATILAALTQQVLAGILNPQTSEELATGVVPVNFDYPPMHVLRYGNNVNPGITDMSAAIQTAVSVAQASANTRWVYFDPGIYATTGITLNGTLQSIKFQGNAATLQNLSNSNALITINAANDLQFDGLYFVGNSSASQLSGHYGISIINAGLTKITNCNFNTLSVGIYVQNTTNTTFLGATVQIPQSFNNNTIINCNIGIYTNDGGAGSNEFGEYCRISNNTITECSNWGIFSQAGNTAIVGNTVQLNFGGICISELGSFNGDHGLIVGNTVNHNNRANLYITNTIRSMIVTGNNFWACLSGQLNVSISRLQGSFGVYLEQCSNIVFTDNVVARNAINMGTFDITNCVIANNCLLTDPANTTLQYTESFVYTSPNFNNYGPNQFEGALSTGLLPTGNPNGDQPVTFTNSWSSFGSGFGNVSYYKDAFNVVHLSGVITGGSIGASAFTLAPTFVPTDGIRVFTCMSNNLFGVLNINTAGQVIPVLGSSVSFCLDGVSFRSGSIQA